MKDNRQNTEENSALFIAKNQKDICYWIQKNKLDLVDPNDRAYARGYSTSDEFNRYIRDDSCLTDFNNLDSHLQSMLQKFSSPQPMIVFRGVAKERYNQMLEDGMKYRDKFSFHTYLCEKGYLSTSFLDSMANNYDIVLRIFVPENTPLIVIGKYSVSQEQNEVLFGKNHVFKVQRKKGREIHVLMVE